MHHVTEHRQHAADYDKGRGVEEHRGEEEIERPGYPGDGGLSVCVVLPGEPRPAVVTAMPGNAHCLAVMGGCIHGGG